MTGTVVPIGGRRAHAYFLVGPTAVGKSAVAQWIAERQGWDIVSADSMAVYAGMDIGTAKPGAAERRRVAYHGIDLVPPDVDFSVGMFVEHVRTVLAAGRRAGRQAIVCGGTGLYVKVLTDGLDDAPPSTRDARRKWEGLLRDEGVEALRERLEALAPERAAALVDPSNARRLIRALELAEAGVGPAPRRWERGARGAVPLIGLMCEPDLLNRRIEERVAAMYAGGLIEETRALLERYGKLSDTAMQAIGYAEALGVLRGDCTRSEAESRTVVRTRRLAKRQRTWFRHQAEVVWISVSSGATVPELARAVMEQWGKYGRTELAGLQGG